MEWLRWYHGACSDSKWPIVARKSGQSVGAVVAVWAALLEHASQDEKRGSVGDFDPEEIDALYGFTDGTAVAIFAAMRAKGLILNGCIAAWNRRQPQREDMTAAVRKRAQRVRERLFADHARSTSPPLPIPDKQDAQGQAANLSKSRVPGSKTSEPKPSRPDPAQPGSAPPGDERPMPEAASKSPAPPVSPEGANAPGTSGALDASAIPARPDSESETGSARASVTHLSRSVTAEQNRDQKKEQRRDPPPPPQGGCDGLEADMLTAVMPEDMGMAFREFMDAYPAVSREPYGEAALVWRRLAREKKLPGLPRLLQGVSDWEDSDQWSKCQGRYIPKAANFLRHAMWLSVPSKKESVLSGAMERLALLEQAH